MHIFHSFHQVKGFNLKLTIWEIDEKKNKKPTAKGRPPQLIDASAPYTTLYDRLMPKLSMMALAL